MSVCLVQLWLMKGQIEEQCGDDINTVREAYKSGVRTLLLISYIIADE